jgi:hypothetical protein
MTNSPEATVEQEVKEQTPGTMPRQQRQLIPCECTILYLDKINEHMVCEDIPQNMPNGLIQFQCGDKIIVVNPQQVRRFEVKAIKQEEKRIIT